MIWKKLKFTVEEPFQRDWLEKGKKLILDEPQDFSFKVDNGITKRAQLSLQIRIVKSTSFMIFTKGQAILVTQKKCQLILGEQKIRNIAARFFWYGIYNDVVDYIQKCDCCQRQIIFPSNIKNEMRSVPVSSHIKKLVGSDICSLPKVDNYHHLIVCNDYFTKCLEANPFRENRALTVATFLYELMCRHGCFKVQINDQEREFIN